MPIDYKPLWHLLLDRNMSKTQLRLASGISTRQLARLGKNEDVSTDVLRKIDHRISSPFVFLPLHFVSF